jgi:hypothetical protein
MSTREEIVAAHSVVMAFLAANNVKEMLVSADVGQRARCRRPLWAGRRASRKPQSRDIND